MFDVEHFVIVLSYGRKPFNVAEIHTKGRVGLWRRKSITKW